jgi:hypothetical protein
MDVVPELLREMHFRSLAQTYSYVRERLHRHVLDSARCIV